MGLTSHPAEVARRIHESRAEVILPDAIHDRSPCEHVVIIGDPFARAARRAPSSSALGTLKRCVQSGTQVNAPGDAGCPGD